MGFWPRLFRRRETKPSKPSTSRRIFFGRTNAGVFIDHEIALTYSAVWAAVRLIAETLASMPWQVFASSPDGGRVREDSNRLDVLMAGRVNGELPSYQWKMLMLSQMALWGNAYCEIDRSPGGNLAALWPLRPDRVSPGRTEEGALVYEVRGDQGMRVVLPADRMLHFRGLGFDGLVGYSVVSFAAQSMGLALASERFGSEFFGNGAHPSYILQHPGSLDEETTQRMKASFEASTGAGKWWRPMIVEQGIQVKELGMPLKDAQFLETRKHQVTEIARWFRVQPHKIGDLSKATFSNIEEQAIEFWTDTILPYVANIENELNVKLLNQNMQIARRRSVKINMRSIMRGNTESRYAAYSVARQWGWMSANDIRKLEDMNPIDNGDIYLTPLNMVDVDATDVEPGAVGGPGEKGDPGDKGDTGEKGDRGEKGDIGFRGKDGKAGEDGVDGAAGEVGERGSDGSPGRDGKDGKAGEDGESGSDGKPGVPGARGEVGSQGVRGDPGDRGPVGFPGGDGKSGVRGEKGACGAKGDSGSPGERGEQGRPHVHAMRSLVAERVRHLCRYEFTRIEQAIRREKGKSLSRFVIDFYAKHVEHMTSDIVGLLSSLDSLMNNRQPTDTKQRIIATTARLWCEERCRRSCEQLQEGKADAVLANWRETREREDVLSIIERFSTILVFGVMNDGKKH